ncbi:hypothetical protein ambt_12715 [Alteromonas naphthalenivorans]|uniref:Uncharacterized protein n=1 Tax=Alteromonas naphthalenivorans TaxID=715451 RepID=F5ZDV1_ALTNA|nr:hypothetical protein ambt_12715 [Alteromonas naphthalenivorans]
MNMLLFHFISLPIVIFIIVVLLANFESVSHEDVL